MGVSGIDVVDDGWGGGGGGSTFRLLKHTDGPLPWIGQVPPQPTHPLICIGPKG